MVHCHGGRSRTGLVLKAWAMRAHGYDERQAHEWLTSRWGRYEDYQSAVRRRADDGLVSRRSADGIAETAELSASLQPGTVTPPADNEGVPIGGSGGTQLTLSPSPCPTADGDAAEQYLAVVVRTVQYLGAERYGIDVADDLVQLVATQFWPRRAEYMANYAPEAFAAVALRSRADELRRSERIQRAEGARLHEGADGLRRPGREVVQLEAHVGAGGALPHADLDVAGRATDVVLVRGALDQLPWRDRALVLLVDGGGYTVTEAADRVGLSRAYANRELTRIRAVLRVGGECGMNPGMQAEETVEVRLRYRPVGDILTVSVRSGAPPGPRCRTELDDDTLIEWMRMPDGTERS